MSLQEGHLSASGPLRILVPTPHPCKLGQKHSPHAELGVETPITKSSFHAFDLEASTHHHASLDCPSCTHNEKTPLDCPSCTHHHAPLD